MNFKTLSVMALAGLMVLGSCKKNEQNTNNNGSVLFAGIEQPTSNAKTSLDPSTGDITWTAGDKIMVNNGVETAEFRLTAGAGQTTATFNGPGAYADATTAYVAAFPAEYVDNISGTTVTFNIPSEQTPTTGNPMVAYGADENLTFTSVLSGLVIKLQGNGAAKTINKLVLTSNKTENLWGTYTFNADGGTELVYVSGGSNAVTLNLPGVTLATGQEYTTCVMVPAGSLANGFKIEIFYNGLSLKSATTSEAMEMAQNTIYNVTYNYPADPATAGTAATQAELNVLLSEVAAGSYTGTININATGSTPTTFDFGGTTLPNDEQVVIAAGANVEVSNFTATVTSASSGYPAAMIISDGANATLNNVTVTSTSTHENTRALNVIGADTEVTLNNCTIDGGDAGYSRGLNVYDGNATVNVVGGSIHAGHYAINIPSTGNGVTINLSDASIASGWAALNVWGQNNTINATNCILRGTNDKSHNSWNDFATIAFNSDNEDCIINLDNCDVYATATTGNKQYAWRMYTGTTGNQFIMHGGSLTGTETNTEDEWGLYLKRIGGTDLEPIYSYDYDFVLLYENVAMNWNGTTSTLNENTHYSGTIGGGGKSQGKFVVEQASETESSKD